MLVEILTISILDSMYGCNHLREGKVATGGASQVGLYASRNRAESAGRVGIPLRVQGEDPGATG